MTLVVPALLGGCESLRFGSGARGPVVASRAVPPVEAPDPTVSSVPSGSVTAEPLPPPPGSAAAPPPVTLGGSPPAEVPTLSGGAGSVATLGAGVPDTPRGGGGRSAAIGGWTARDAAGASCKVNLSSTPSLDLYRASASGCPNKDLSRVTAWDFKDGEVYLFQPGGAVAARLRSSGGDLSGVLSKSGAPLTLTRS